MPDTTPQPDQTLHLPSLVIKNFRGIDELTIPRLGRVTLLAGKNGVGKTTVLDAVRVWADRGWAHVFDAVLEQRGDSLIAIENAQKRVVVDRTALFTNRPDSPEVCLSVATAEGDKAFQIRQVNATGQLAGVYPSRVDVLDNLHLEMQFAENSRWDTKKSGLFHGNSPPNAAICNTLGPDRPTDETVEQYWSEVALTPDEDRALEALNLITAAEVERVAALGPPISTNSKATQPRRMMAKVEGVDYQVPLRSLGDGAMRTYAVALVLAKSSGGFLLVDEAENGIHHSVQPKFWNMVLQTAQRNNVQVIATTHSWDCVTGFAQAANELEDVEGLLVRIERVPIGLRAITYDESRLDSIVKYGIEAR